MKSQILVICFILAALLVIPQASATVTANVMISSPSITGLDLTLTYSKFSEAGDGQQTGTVFLNYTGPESGSLAAQTYNVAETITAIETWTFQVWTPGTYTFTFDDDTTSGVEVDKTLETFIAAAFNFDWVTAIQENAGDQLRVNNNPLTVDASGRAYVSVGRRHPGEALGWDGWVQAYSRQGVQRWASQFGVSSNFDENIIGLIYDNGGRLMSLHCLENAGTFVHTVGYIHNLENGATNAIGINLDTQLPVAQTDCGTSNMGAIDARADGATDVELLFGFGDIGRLALFDTEFNLIWASSQVSINGPEAHIHPNETLGLMRGTISASPGDELLLFNATTGGVQATRNINSQVFPTGRFIHRSTDLTYTVMATGASTRPCEFIWSVALSPTSVGANTPCDFIWTGDATGTDDYETSAIKPVVAYLDGADRPIVCNTLQNDEGDNHHALFLMGFLADGNNNGGIRVDADIPSIPVPGGTPLCLDIRPDPLGGFYVLMTDALFSGPSGTDVIYLAHYTPNTIAGQIYTNPTLQLQSAAPLPAGVGGSGPTAPPITEGPIRAIQDLFDEGWGTTEAQSDWIFGVAIVIVLAIGISSAMGFSVLGAGLGVVLGVPLAWALGFFPIWVVLMMVFVIIAMAGSRFFGNGGEE